MTTTIGAVAAARADTVVPYRARKTRTFGVYADRDGYSPSR